MDAAWKDSITKTKWWAKAEKDPAVDPLLYELRDGLIKLGGEAACLPWIEEDIDKLMTRGQLWTGSNLKMAKGKNSQCHYNSGLLWEANQEKDLFIATGYALSEEGGLWRQHSWCVQKKARSMQIIETTEPRALYFGFVLTLDETIDFAFDNTDGIEVNPETVERYNDIIGKAAGMKP